MIAMGLLYPCFASRAEIAAAADPAKTDPDGAPLYPGLWKGASADAISARMAAGEAPALRLDMDGALKALARKRGDLPLTFTEVGQDGTRRTIVAEPQRWGDAVIVRKEVPASYHLSVVVDDARQGVTHVTRGEDLFAATDLQRLLQELLDLPEPVYSHHRVIRWADGRKLSKSNRDMGLRVLRRGRDGGGYSPGHWICLIGGGPNQKFSALHLFCLLTAGGICNINCRKIAIAELIRERKARQNNAWLVNKMLKNNG